MGKLNNTGIYHSRDAGDEVHFFLAADAGQICIQFLAVVTSCLLIFLIIGHVETADVMMMPAVRANDCMKHRTQPASWQCLHITVSTVVLNCCKNDRPSQWEYTIFGPLYLENLLTDFHEICYQWLSRGPHHTRKLRISGIKLEPVPIIVNYTPPVSIFLQYLSFFLCVFYVLAHLYRSHYRS